ncbi:MAG TPA: peptidylprolyl isomerase [Terriglobales bacterium]|nr:peptidylprolyl isomerase [Terriglobales bacterium]
MRIPSICLSPVVVVGLASVLSAEVVNKIIATVDGEPITMHELSQYRRQTAQDPQLSRLSGSDLLEALITDKIVDREAEAKGLAVRKDDIDRYVDSVKERNRIDDAKLVEALAAQGMTLDAYRAQVKREIQRQQLINREIRGKVNVTPEEIERYYNANRGEYSAPAGYEVAHIVFRTSDAADGAEAAAVRAKADQVYQQLRGGADFAEMAKRHSEDSGSAKDGGVLGWFKAGELVESLDKEAVKLKTGEISPPVRGPNGLHILKVTQRRGEGADKPLPETAEEIKQKLYAEALDVRFREWLKSDLRKNHHVQILQ